MSFELPLWQPGVWKSNSDFTTKQYLAVVLVALTSDGTPGVDIASTAGAAILGINQDDCILGGTPQLTTEGISKAKAGATITIGQILAVNSSGAFVPAATGNFGVAYACEAAVSGDTFAVYLRNFGKQ